MLQLVREIPISIEWQGALSERRGFLFHLAAGFSKPLDPLTGMTVNLSSVDRWLADVRSHCLRPIKSGESQNLNEDLVSWGMRVRAHLEGLASAEGARVESLTFREERGWSFSWNRSLDEGESLFSYCYFTESFSHSPVEPPRIFKVELTFKRLPGSTLDYHQEGLKIMESWTPQGPSPHGALVRSLHTLLA